MERTNRQKREENRISVVLFAVYILFLAASVLLFLRILGIQLFFKPDPDIAAALSPKSTRTVIEPERGKILDRNGKILAISCPTYQLYMDCTIGKEQNKEGRKGKKHELEWREKVRELSVGLSGLFPEKTAEEHFNAIIKGRETGRKYLKIGHAIDRNEYNEALNFPLFKEGRYQSGLIVETSDIRQYPYGSLARRTIGFVRNNKSMVSNTHIGLEGKFDHILHGTEGEEWLRRTDYGKIRDNDSSYRKAIPGLDLMTTIDIDYQEIADKALREQIEGNEEIEGACLVLMETATGAIRSMVNLKQDEKTGRFEESQNWAVTRKCEPGSVFKTVTLLSLLNDGYIKSIEETLPATDGNVAGTNIKDKHIPEWRQKNRKGRISVLEGMKISSNYVFATLAIQHYGKEPSKFIENIYSYKLGDNFDFDLDGMPTPTIPNPSQKGWSNNILGRVGFGYSTMETPIHILTFYNAIANKGVMVKPYLVEGTVKNGTITEKRKTSILNASICTESVSREVTEALLAVTEDGTAKWSLMNVKCPVAGKTGTSFGSYGKSGYTDKEGRRKFQGTFVCFFPADNPVYTMICQQYSKPTKNTYDGGGLPAKACKNVINKLYTIDPAFRPEISMK